MLLASGTVNQLYVQDGLVKRILKDCKVRRFLSFLFAALKKRPLQVVSQIVVVSPCSTV